MLATTRHFTATGFVVHDDSIALHWHPKVKAWLPPGGHIEPNEDPVQAVLREIEEETGLKASYQEFFFGCATGIVGRKPHPKVV